MSTALSLTVYDQITDLNASVLLVGNAIALSGMFGCESKEQGQVMALECFARKTPPLMLAETYHLIKGKLSMKADAMLARFNDFGGEHRVISKTGDLASIELTYKGKTDLFSFSWEEAQQEPLVYNGKEEDVVDKILAHAADNKKPLPKLKPKYATPRARSQMLWARVVSDSVRTVCPQACHGRYTPEELEEDDDAAEAVAEKPSKARAAKKADVVQPGGGSAAAAEAAKDDGVIDAEFVVKPDAAKETPPTGGTTPLPAGTTEPQYATHSQVSKIEELLNKLGATPDSREKMLQKRKVNSLRSLTIGQADELILGLAKKLTEVKLAGGVVNPGEVQSAPLPPPGPCSTEQQAEAKQRLQELKQVNPPAFGGFVGWLKSKGLKIEHLSARDCDRLIAAAKDVKTMDDFFAKSLEEWKPKETAATSTTLAEPPTGDKPADAATVAANQQADVPFETASSKN